MPSKTNQGGAQPGAGRKPGHLLRNVPTGTPPPRQSALVAHPGHLQAAAALRARGLSYESIARQLNHSRVTISQWLRDNPELVDAECERIAHPDDIFRRMLPAAADAYQRALVADEAAIALKAAESVADRVFGKPIVRSQSQVQLAALVEISFGD